MKATKLIILTVLFLYLMPSVFAVEKNKQATMKNAYPIDFCVVSGEKLGGMGDPVSYSYQGREIEFCCSSCISSFEKDPEKYLAILDNGIVDAQSKDYPLNSCVVSGEKLGGMGKPVDIVYNNELVKLCCNGCKKDFNRNPEKYMKKIHDARKAHMMKDNPMENMHESMEMPSNAEEHNDDHKGHDH